MSLCRNAQHLLLMTSHAQSSLKLPEKRSCKRFEKRKNAHIKHIPGAQFFACVHE